MPIFVSYENFADKFVEQRIVAAYVLNDRHFIKRQHGISKVFLV